MQLNFETEEIKRLPQRHDEVWQGGLVRLSMWTRRETGGEPFRPYLALWLSANADCLGQPAFCEPDEAEPARLWEAFLALARDEQVGGRRPGRLEVADAALADYLRERCEGLGMEVLLRDELPELNAAVSFLIERMGIDDRTPGPLSGKGVTVERMRRFAEAAADFHRAAPWRHFSNIDLLHIESPKAPKHMAYATVLGAGATCIGIGFYHTAEHLWEVQRAGLPLEMLAGKGGGVWSLTFDPLEETPIPDSELWEAHDLPLAEADAYPWLGRMDARAEQIARPDAQRLGFVEGLLRALAATSEEQIDTGRWMVAVETFDGPVEYTLALPDLLKPPSFEKWRNRGVPLDMRVIELMQVQAQRLLEYGGAQDKEKADQLLADLFQKKKFDALPCPGRTPLERAQDICYQAFAAHGRRKVQLAKQALELTPDCADAYLILAEWESDARRALPLLEKALEVSERVLGEQKVDECSGRLSEVIEARPYMRARAYLVRCLDELGMAEEALEHGLELLELDPVDRMQVIFIVLPLLAELDQDEEAERLVDEYDDEEREAEAFFAYLRALLAFRRHGNDAASRQALAEAVRVNRYLVPCLLDPDPDPADQPEGFMTDDHDEALMWADRLAPAFEATPGALDWLAKHGKPQPVRKRPKGKPRRSKK